MWEKIDCTPTQQRILSVFCACVFLLAACANEKGDATRGKQVYDATLQGSRGEIEPCASCHPIVEGENAKIMGNNLYDIGRRADKMVAGQGAEEYLRRSILDPDSFLAANFQEGIMPREYSKVLTNQQIEDLIAFMLTLKP
jgi:hypothetical protein